MAYVKTQAEAAVKYPYTVGMLRQDNPRVSFPRNVPDDTLASYGVYPVETQAPPAIDEKTHKAVRAPLPVKLADQWVLQWSVVEKTAGEKQEYYDAAASDVRGKRAKLLSETDWVVVFHTEKGTNIPLEWEVYRQALRDITDHVNFPHLHEADWPAKPG